MGFTIYGIKLDRENRLLSESKKENDKTWGGCIRNFVEKNKRITGLLILLGVTLMFTGVKNAYSRLNTSRVIKKIKANKKERELKARQKALKDQQKSTSNKSQEQPSVTSEIKAPSPFQYEVNNGVQPTISFVLQPGEELVGERASMLYRSKQVSMYTVSGDDIGFSTGATSMLKRLLSGESIFFINYINESDEPANVTLSPGSIGTLTHFDLSKYPEGIYSSNGAFFVSDTNVKLEVISKNSFKNLLSSRGLFQQRYTGDGNVITFAPGKIEKLEIPEGEEIVTDVECLFAWTNDDRVEFKRQKVVEAATNGEGLYVCNVKGPNTIWITSRGNSFASSSGIGSAVNMLS